MLTRLTIYLLLALAPLPFGSARPGWQWLWVLIIALAAIGHVFFDRKKTRQPFPKAIRIAFVLFSTFILWGLTQASPLFETLGAMSTLPIDSLLPEGVGNRLHSEKAIAISLYFLSHLLFFYLVFCYCADPKNAVKLIRFCGIVGFMYAAYGFVVYVTGNETVLWYEKTGEAGTRSLTSSFVNRNNFAAFAGIGLQCLIAYAYVYFRNAFQRQGLTGRQLLTYLLETVISRIWWLVMTIFIVAVSILLTESRGGFATIAAACGLLVVLAPQRRADTQGKSRKVIGYGALLVAVLGLFAFSGDNLETRLAMAGGVNERFHLYPLVVDAILDAPLTGTGLGTFSEVFATYRTEDVAPHFLRAHSDYLELALTAGIPAALLVFVGCFMPALFLMRKLGTSSEYRCFIALGISVSVQIGLHTLIDFPLQIPAISYMVCAVLAATVALANGGEAYHKKQLP